MENLSDALDSKDKLKLNRLDDVIESADEDEQSLLILSSDTLSLNLKFEEYLTTNINNIVKIGTIKDGLFKKILSNVKEYKNKYILINLFSIKDYIPIREEFQFKRDYIPQERLKFIFLLNFSQYESFKTKAYDFFSFNNFFHHFIDNSFTFVNDIDLSELDNMIKEYEKIKDTNISKESRMKYLFDIGEKAHEFSQLNTSLKYLDKAFVLANKLKDIFAIAYISNIKADINVVFGDFDKALEYQKKSLKISKKIKYPMGITASLGGMGNIYKDLGDYELALNNYQKSLDISIKEKDKDNESTALLNIGVVYQNIDKLDLALEYYNKSLMIAKEINKLKGIALSLVSIGNLYSVKNDLDSALKYQNEALNIFKNIGNMEGVCESLYNISYTYQKLKNFDLVERYRDKALEIAKSLGFHAIIAKIEKDKINNKEER